MDGKLSLLRFDLNGKLNEMKKKYYKFLRRVEDWDNNLPTFPKKTFNSTGLYNANKTYKLPVSKYILHSISQNC